MAPNVPFGSGELVASWSQTGAPITNVDLRRTRPLDCNPRTDEERYRQRIEGVQRRLAHGLAIAVGRRAAELVCDYTNNRAADHARRAAEAAKIVLRLQSVEVKDPQLQLLDEQRRIVDPLIDQWVAIRNLRREPEGRPAIASDWRR